MRFRRLFCRRTESPNNAFRWAHRRSDWNASVTQPQWNHAPATAWDPMSSSSWLRISCQTAIRSEHRSVAWWQDTCGQYPTVDRRVHERTGICQRWHHDQIWCHACQERTSGSIQHRISGDRQRKQSAQCRPAERPLLWPIQEIQGCHAENIRKMHSSATS